MGDWRRGFYFGACFVEFVLDAFWLPFSAFDFRLNHSHGARFGGLGTEIQSSLEEP
jgi:hypothetical protein